MSFMLLGCLQVVAREFANQLDTQNWIVANNLVNIQHGSAVAWIVGFVDYLKPGDRFCDIDG